MGLYLDYFSNNTAEPPNPLMKSMSETVNKMFNQEEGRVLPWEQGTDPHMRSFQDNLFTKDSPRSHTSFLDNIDDNNNYKAKQTVFDQDNLVDSPLLDAGERMSKTAEFYLKSAPQAAIDLGGKVPSHSIDFGGHLLDINGGGEVFNLDHHLHGSPEDTARLALTVSDGLYLLDTVNEVVFNNTSWNLIGFEDTKYIEDYSPEELNTTIQDLIMFSLPDNYNILDDELFDYALWGTSYGNKELLPSLLGPRVTVEIDHQLENIIKALSPEEVFGSWDSEITMGDKAAEINSIISHIANTNPAFSNWWDNSSTGKVVNAISSVTKVSGERSLTFEREFTNKYGLGSELSKAIQERYGLGGFTGTSSLISDEERQQVEEYVRDKLETMEKVSEKLLLYLRDPDNPLKNNLKSGLESVIKHGIVPSIIRGMGDQVMDHMSDADGRETATQAFRTAVTTLSETFGLFSGISWPWIGLNDTEWAKQLSSGSPIKEAIDVLTDPTMVEQRENDASDAASVNGPLDKTNITRIRPVDPFEAGYLAYVNFGLSNQNFDTFEDAQNFIGDVLRNPDKYTLAQQSAYLTVFNEAFTLFNDMMDSGTMTNAQDDHMGLVWESFVALRGGNRTQIQRTGVNSLDFVLNVNNNKTNEALYNTEEGERVWREIRRWMNERFLENVDAIAPDGWQYKEDKEGIPRDWGLLPQSVPKAGQRFSYDIKELERDPVRRAATIRTLMDIQEIHGWVNEQGRAETHPALKNLLGSVHNDLIRLDDQAIRDAAKHGIEGLREIHPAFSALAVMDNLTGVTGNLSPSSISNAMLAKGMGWKMEDIDLYAVVARSLKNTYAEYNPMSIALAPDPKKLQRYAAELMKATSHHRQILGTLADHLTGRQEIQNINRPSANLDRVHGNRPAYETPKQFETRMKTVVGPEIPIDGIETDTTALIASIQILSGMGIKVAYPGADVDSGWPWDWFGEDVPKNVFDSSVRALVRDYKALVERGLITDEHHQYLISRIGDPGEDYGAWFAEGKFSGWSAGLMGGMVVDGMNRFLNHGSDASSNRITASVMASVLGRKATPEQILRASTVMSIDPTSGMIQDKKGFPYIVPDIRAAHYAFNMLKRLGSDPGVQDPFNTWSSFNSVRDGIAPERAHEDRANMQGRLTTVRAPVEYTAESREASLLQMRNMLADSNLMRNITAGNSTITIDVLETEMRKVLQDYERMKLENPELKPPTMDRARLIVTALQRLDIKEVGELQLRTKGGNMFTPNAIMEQYNLYDIHYQVRPRYQPANERRSGIPGQVDIFIGTKSAMEIEGSLVYYSIGTVPLKWRYYPSEDHKVNRREVMARRRAGFRDPRLRIGDTRRPDVDISYESGVPVDMGAMNDWLRAQAIQEGKMFREVMPGDPEITHPPTPYQPTRSPRP